jgi:transposase
VSQLPDLSRLSHAEKDVLILALFQRLEAAERRIAELEARLGEPPKTPDNSSLPPSKGQKPTTSRRNPGEAAHGRAVWVARVAVARWLAIPTRR